MSIENPRHCALGDSECANCEALQAENTKLKELLREANEELMTHPVGLCNRIHQALSDKG